MENGVKEELMRMTEGLDEWCAKRERRRAINVYLFIAAGTAALTVGGVMLCRYVVSVQEGSTNDTLKIEVSMLEAEDNGNWKECWTGSVEMKKWTHKNDYHKSWVAYRKPACCDVRVPDVRRRVASCHVRRGDR